MNSPNSIKFPLDRIKLKRIYQSKDIKFSKNHHPVGSKIKEVYGEFSFPAFPDNRTYTLGSFVQSIDGKIAFPESPDGTLVAKGNMKDPDGALADYWILNMLRSVSDAVLMGSRTIEKESELTGHIFDCDLADSRKKEGKPPVPLHIIVTGSGAGIPFNHKIFKSKDIPVLIATSPEGKKLLLKSLDAHFIDLNRLPDVCLTSSIKAVVSVGMNNNIDLTKLLYFLKKHGINTMLIESPSFLVSLMKKALLDELYLNTSSLFIGGNALSLGQNIMSFTFKNHPYGKILSIHTHSDYFFYTRYKMEYAIFRDDS